MGVEYNFSLALKFHLICRAIGSFKICTCYLEKQINYGRENPWLHLNNFSLERFVNMVADTHTHTHTHICKQIHTSAAAK